MTVPGGVPNLPFNALTLDNLATRLQDMTPPAIRQLANQGLPGIFNASNGGNVLSDLTPFGVITRLFAEFASAVANADPNDIQGPEDLPGLMLDFIEGLPIIGELIGLLEAINGQYDGDDAVLLAVQQIFHPIRKLLQLISGQPVGFPTVEDVTTGWVSLGDAVAAVALDTANFLAATGQATLTALGTVLQTLISWLSAIPANLLSGALPTGVTLSGTPIGDLLQFLSPAGLYDAAQGFTNQATSLLKHLTPTGGNVGQFDAAYLQGTLNNALQIGSAAVSSIFNGSGQFIGVLNSAATGALSSAITFGGHALSTVLTNITAATGAINAGGLTGTLNNAVLISGQAVSALFNGSGQFIGQINAAATGTLNGAIQLGGTALSTLSTNWNAAVTNINNLIGGVTGAATVADVATNINLAATNIAQIGTAAQNAAAGIVGSLNAAATQVQTAFTGVLAGLFGAVNNVPASAASQSSVNTAVTNLTASATAAAASTSALQSSLALTAAPAAPSLMSAVINFNAYPNSAGLPGVFTQTNIGTPSGPGTFGIVNGLATWSGTSGATFILMRALYSTVTTSDYQVVSATLSGAATGTLPFAGFRLMGRSNAAGTTYVEARFIENGVSLQAVVAGVYTELASANIVLNPTATYTLICGIPNSGVVKFQILCNGTPIPLSPSAGRGTSTSGVFTETAGISQYGASYRTPGFLNFASNGSGPTMYQWTAADNPFVAGGAASAFVSTSQNSTSTTYAALATALSVTATIGSSGMALVLISSNLQNNTQASRSYMSYAVSGATTKAAADDHCIAIGIPAAVADMGYFSGAFLETGLTPGSNTFAAQHRVSATTGTFQNRRISVIPL